MKTFNFLKTVSVIAFGGLIFFAGFQPNKKTLESVKEDLSGQSHFKLKKTYQDLTKLAQELSRLGTASAGGTYTKTAINLVRNSVGMAIGYGSRADWMGLNCASGNENQCPPQDGIVGAIASVFSRLKDVATNAGVTSCASLPSTGSMTATDTQGVSWTVHFQVPTHKVPANWLNGGTDFQKRVAFSIPNGAIAAATDIKVAFEFNCGDSDAQYVVMNMPQDSNSTAYKRYITVYSGPIDSTRNGIDTYLAEFRQSGNEVRGATAIRIEYKPSDTTFKMYGVLGNNSIENGNGGIGYFGRAFLNGNYSTGDASLFLSAIASNNTTDGANNNFYYDVSAIETGHAVTSATDLTNGGEGAPNSNPSANLGTNLDTFFNNSTVDDNGHKHGDGSGHPNDKEVFSFRGCVNLLSYSSSPANTDDCASYPLDSFTAAPYIGTGGTFTIKWILDNIVSTQEALP